VRLVTDGILVLEYLLKEALMTNAELAVLSLLVERPRHGYDIEKVIEERGMRDWTDVGFSSIYYILSKLEKQALVAARADSSGPGPARKVYAPTAAGFEACGRATIEALSTLRAPNPFMLGLSNIVGLPDADALEALRTYRAALAARLAQVRLRSANAGGAQYVADLFDYGIRMLDAELEWVSALVTRREQDLKEAGKMSPRKLKTDPEFADMPARTVAVVHTKGDPADLGEGVFKALYGSVYTLKFDLKKAGAEFRIEPPRARWFAGADWRNVPRDQWEAGWAIPVPDGTTEVPQKVPGTPVVVERWEYGTVAQILHLGAYSEEEPNINRLHTFIEEQGYEIVGPHEEEYQSRPGAKTQKTVIRYQVRKR
jgi:DNA-binding PadR family transcriptional regulator